MLTLCATAATFSSTTHIGNHKMFSSTNDIYFIKPGQKIVLSQYDTTLTDIYREAVNMDSVLDIQNNVHGDYVVSLQSNIRVTDFAKTMVLSGLDSATMTIPTGMNLGSLKSCMYQLMTVSGNHYKMVIDNEKITIAKKEINDISGKIESLPVGEKIFIKSDNPLSTRITAYRHAKKIGVTVKIKMSSCGIEVVATEKKNEDEKDYYNKFEQWVIALPYNRPHQIPPHLSRKDDAYIRTCMSKTGLDLEMKNGVIWRKKCCLKKRKGVIQLKYCDQVIYRFESPGSYIKAEHVSRINLLIKPYGLTYEDLK